MAKRDLNRDLGVLILAAGVGTRMESDLPKVLHYVAGETMLGHVLKVARQLKPSKIAVVIGHQGELVKKTFQGSTDIVWMKQKELKGTGDAVRSAIPAFENFEGPVLILYGDIPGIKNETLQRLRMVHSSSQNTVTLLTAELDDPSGYGRIVLDADGSVGKIVEEKDSSDLEKEILEVNTGIGIWESKFLFSSVKLLQPTNKQKEFYLTDLIQMARSTNKTVGRLRMRDSLETLGINDREDLAGVTGIFYEEKARSLLKSGVTMEDPSTVYVEPHVDIGKDSFLGPSIRIRKASRLGEKVSLVGGNDLSNVEIGNRVHIGHHVSIHDTKIGEGTKIFAGTVIGTVKRKDK